MKPANATCHFPCKALSLLAASVLALLGGAVLLAQQSKPGEYQVKAAYIYNFGRFVQWPAKVYGQESEFTICVLGQDPFGPALDSTLAGKVLNGKPVAMKRISKAQEAANCRILFVSANQSNHLQEILGILNQAPVLTVSDMPGFSQRGGMIQFALEEDKVRFEVNLASSENAGLMLSSELLKVASSVRRNARSGDK